MVPSAALSKGSGSSRRYVLTAAAKVNLVLEVLGKRDDGYHEIATVMQTVDLTDRLTLDKPQADGNGRGQLRGTDGALMRTDALSLFTPTVFLYDNFPGGVGQSEPLWRRQAELLARAGELVERCDCRSGCPACVGPVLAADEDKDTDTPKSLARRVLSLLAAA